MEINYDNIHRAIAALNKCAKEFENKPVSTGAVRVSDLCTDISYFLCKVRQDHKHWQETNADSMWKLAVGNELPDIDREVIALTVDGKVVFAHRPQESWQGKNINTGDVTTHYPKRYGSGGWNIPDVYCWLDIDIPMLPVSLRRLEELAKKNDGKIPM